MKITICAYDAPGNIDGPSAWMKRLLPSLKSRGFHIRIIFFSDRSKSLPTYQYFAANGFVCKKIYWDKFDHEKMVELIDDLKQYPPDIFIPNYFPIAMEVARLIKSSAISIVMALHNDNAFHYALVKEYAELCDAVVCVSKAIAEMTIQIIPAHKGVFTIPYGAPVPEKAAAYPDSVLKLVYAGRLNEHQKRISDVTKALCKAAATIEGIECSIYGSGQDLANVKRIIAEESNGVKVQYKGSLDSHLVQQHLLENHIFVLLSDFEGIPIALMEAMACGLVPVCTNVKSGMTELITHKINGLLVDDRSVAFLDAIKFLKENPLEWQRMSDAAKETIHSHYSEELCNQKWFDLLQSLKPITTTGISQPATPIVKLKSIRLRSEFLAHSNPAAPTIFIPVYRVKKWLGRLKRKFLS
ncbi:MAG: glycosyltransferase [Chitinophagaceae bacterium]|nr:MAG: glycosyltransferase [Chitinophagaceae bacterium]